jgi:hypothetical protein
MQAAFEKCVPIMKAEDIRQARLAVLDPLLRQSGRYPIDQRDTALKPGP